MSFDNIFGVFSRRPKQLVERKKLTPEFKNRVLMLCAERHYPGPVFREHSPFWAEVHRKLTFLVGRPSLSNTRSSTHS